MNMQNILEEYLPDVFADAEQRWDLFMNASNGKLDKKKKLQSELMSIVLEAAFEDTVPNTRSGDGDHEADVYIDGVPLEIKTTHDSRQWRGGEYSKRGGDFLLVTWKLDDNDGLKMWAAHVVLQKEDWTTSGSDNYYATTIDLDTVLNLDAKVLIGEVAKKIKLTHPVHAKVL
jgi:hypothetical protein